MTTTAEIERLTYLINSLKGRPGQAHTVAVLERRIEALRQQ